LFSFGFTCLVYHATTRFCKRVYGYKNDPLGKASGQMIGAARSARQNIAEASVRAGTSAETEIRLLDVAKASLEELGGDYEAYLIGNRQAVWSEQDERWQAVRALKLDVFEAKADIAHAFSLHMIAMCQRFAPWFEHEDGFVAANAVLVTLGRAQDLLFRQMERAAEAFGEAGGVRERTVRLRLKQRETLQAAKADEAPPPVCSVCEKPMKLRKAKTGPSAGKSFWGCTGFPHCRAIQEVER
jgi:four helix bundle suffix protein